MSSTDDLSREEKWDIVSGQTRSTPTSRRRTYRDNHIRQKAEYDVISTGTCSGAPAGNSMGTYSQGSNTRYVLGTQFTVSEGHPFRSNPSTGKTDIGGDFFTQKKYVDVGPIVKVETRYDDPAHCRYFSSHYSGQMMASDPLMNGWPDESKISSNSQLDALGTVAIARCKPTNPVGGLTTALIELRRDGLPHLFGSTLWEGKTSIVRNAGEEYLNKEFGWDPLSKDVSDFLTVVTDAHSVIQRYKRGIGRPTRRRFDFTSVETESQIDLGMHWPYTAGYNPNLPDGFNQFPYVNFPGEGSASPGRLNLSQKVKIDRWFTGAFTYYFPPKVASKLGDLAILAHELGLELSPENLWAAAPWSWAVDWFSNAGDVISNYTSFHEDGLVMTYGYIMEHSVMENTYTLKGATDINGNLLPVHDLRFVIETKQRRGATPYGFGLTLGALSGFQQSIIGALGLTKIFR